MICLSILISAQREISSFAFWTNNPIFLRMFSPRTVVTNGIRQWSSDISLEQTSADAWNCDPIRYNLKRPIYFTVAKTSQEDMSKSLMLLEFAEIVILKSGMMLGMILHDQIAAGYIYPQQITWLVRYQWKATMEIGGGMSYSSQSGIIANDGSFSWRYALSMAFSLTITYRLKAKIDKSSSSIIPKKKNIRDGIDGSSNLLLICHW